ncbi:DUF1282 family protein [Reinekea forsetii]|nr:DUF1282 family protein [Reinekea forsetii]
MFMNHIVGIFSNPDNEWARIRDEKATISQHCMTHTLVLALIPAICGFIGTTQVGWTVGSSDTVYTLTTQSAMVLCILFYGAMVSGVVVLGKFIDFLSVTYQDKTENTPLRGISLATYTSTPLFICGFAALYPVLWLDLILALAAIAYAVYLLYEGVPILMNIPKERGFVFASAIITVAMVMFVSLLALTVIVWALGVGPVYITH